MADDETDLKQLHKNMRDLIAKRFPAFKTVAFYRDEESEDMPLPACLLELDEIEPSERNEDIGTDQLGAKLKFSARVIFSRATNTHALLDARLAATALSVFINKNTWESFVYPARIISASKDYFKPDLTNHYAIWRVEFFHSDAFFGPNVWDTEKPKLVTAHFHEVPYA